MTAVQLGTGGLPFGTLPGTTLGMKHGVHRSAMMSST